MKKKLYLYNQNRFCVAPMLNYTDEFCNYFHRQLTKKSILYTEMMTTKYILNQKKKNLKKNIYNPIAIQLAGSNIEDLVKCSKISYNQGYHEINLNVGCPSKSAKFGMFGVFLMKKISLVTKIVKSITNAIPIPVSIKTRIGINNKKNCNLLNEFIHEISTNTVCKTFIIHARNAFTKIYSPKKNRSLPTLKYDVVYEAKKKFPHLNIIINGGITTIKDSLSHLKKVDGVMLGQEVYKNPSLLNSVDEKIFDIPEKNCINKIQLIHNMFPYIQRKIDCGIPIYKITRHMLGFFKGEKGSKKWKTYLSNESYKKNAGINVIEKAIDFIHL